MAGIRSGVIAAILSALSLAVLVSVAQVDTPNLTASDLDASAPFGLRWDPPPSEVFALRRAEEKYCLSDPVAQKLLSTGQDETCWPADDRPLYYEGLIGDPAEVSVSSYWNKNDQPILFRYSFLHEVYPFVKSGSEKRRAVHAQEIQDDLIKLYGAPIAAGEFYPGSKSIYFPDETTEATCKGWIVDKTAIMLCANQIVLIDGVETSISFIRLDRSSSGLPLLKQLVEDYENHELFEEIKANSLKAKRRHALLEADKFRVELENWRTGSKTKYSCAEAEFSSIEEYPTPTELEHPVIQDALNTLLGDQLAEFAFDLQSNSQLNYNIDTTGKLQFSLIIESHKQGSVLATSEIGSALATCRFGMKQNFKRAEEYLLTAAEERDQVALYVLAWLQLSGKAESGGPGDGVKTLKRCAETGYESCVEYLNWYEALVEAGEMKRLRN